MCCLHTCVTDHPPPTCAAMCPLWPTEFSMNSCLNVSLLTYRILETCASHRHVSHLTYRIGFICAACICHTWPTEPSIHLLPTVHVSHPTCMSSIHVLPTCVIFNLQNPLYMRCLHVSHVTCSVLYTCAAYMCHIWPAESSLHVLLTCITF